MKTEDQLSPLSLAILGLVSQEPRSGYDLRKIFATTPMGHFSASPGAIYPALVRLEKSGLIRGTVERKNTLRPRRLYTPAAKGRRLFAEALARPVTREDVIWRLDEILLCFAFVGGVLGLSHAVTMLRGLLTEAEAHLRWLRAQRDTLPSEVAPFGHLAMDHGIESYDATVRWARRAIRQLEKGGGSSKI
jgi:DNA-binding PadR family transcriptional regulator